MTYSIWKCSVCNGSYSSELAAEKCLQQDTDLQPFATYYECSICIGKFATSEAATKCFVRHFQNAKVYKEVKN